MHYKMDGNSNSIRCGKYHVVFAYMNYIDSSLIFFLYKTGCFMECDSDRFVKAVNMISIILKYNFVFLT